MSNNELLENLFSTTCNMVTNLDDEGEFTSAMLNLCEVQQMLEEGHKPGEEQMQMALAMQTAIIEMNKAMQEDMIKKYLEL